MEEPSVLDFVKSKIAPWKYPLLNRPDPGPNGELTPGTNTEAIPTPSIATSQVQVRTAVTPAVSAWPWRSVLALFLGVVAQASLEPQPDRDWKVAVLLYGLALVWALLAAHKGEWNIASLPATEVTPDSMIVRTGPLLISVPLAVIAFFSFSGNRFTTFNLLLLTASLGCLIASFWQSTPGGFQALGRRIRAFFQRGEWTVHITPGVLLIVGVIVLAAFFRFYQLNAIPSEMNSDHAEKLIDIRRVLDGETNIFFPSNGGREALQMYLVAALHRLFGLDLGYLILKLSASIIGFLSLPFIYGLGKEIGGSRVGLLAMAFTGVAYWPNVVSRMGLRLPFYIFFSAALMYFLIRGMKYARRNEFILAGIILGLGFYGYSSDRILPLLVVVGIGLWAVHHLRVPEIRNRAFPYILIIVLLTLVLFLPMARYMMEQPDSFLYRTLSRLTSLERPLEGSPWKIFWSNLGNALVMFSWDDGEIWTLSVPHRPSLDIVTGALYWLGLGLVLYRYIRRRHWLDLFLLFSIPILLMPSVLALAFPRENPNLYRAGGALVPAFILIALALDGLMSAFQARFKHATGTKLAWTVAAFLLLLSSLQSYDLVFHQYANEYSMSSWNSSEMGQVVHQFTETMGSVENTWVMAYPYWVDTRLVGTVAGFPDREFAMNIENLPSTVIQPGPKLFLVKPDDLDSQQELRHLYPNGWFQTYKSKVETKDFLIFFAPPES